jgi:hypothetical protein
MQGGACFDFADRYPIGGKRDNTFKRFFQLKKWRIPPDKMISGMRPGGLNRCFPG